MRLGSIFKGARKKIGVPPGSLIYVGEKRLEEPRAQAISYDSKTVNSLTFKNAHDVCDYKDRKAVCWINIDGLHDINLMGKIGDCFNIHPLVMEDILNVNQRPKFEDHGDYLFIVLKMISFNNDESNCIDSEQVSVILGPKFLITFQERPGDVFDSVRNRIHKAGTRIRETGTDYLAYSLIDAIIDSYYITLDKISEKIERLENSVMTDTEPENMRLIHKLRGCIIQLRKSIWPLREVANNLLRSNSKIIKDRTNIFIKDLYDHIIQATDSIDVFRDMLSGLMDVHLSSISNKTNEVMKVLTVFAAIFIPLTFIVGIYGMNFEYMPELKWKFAYPLLLVAMLSVAVGMLLYFKKRKWL